MRPNPEPTRPRRPRRPRRTAALVVVALGEEGAREDQWWITSVTTLGWFVAVDGTMVIGLIAAIPREESGDHHVISTWVAPERRGSGVAQQLVAAVVAWALSIMARRPSCSTWPRTTLVPDASTRGRDSLRPGPSSLSGAILG